MSVQGQDGDDPLHEMTASYSEISIDSNDSDRDSELFIFSKFSKASSGQARPLSLEIQSEPATEEASGLKYLETAGTVEKEGDMVLFFSQDLENKIKLSSPVSVTSRDSTPCLYRQALEPHLPPLDSTVLNNLEAEARRVATAVDALTENLAGYLHSVSALTVDCLEAHRDAVCSTCDAVDSNIKAMYQLMAKSEELSKSMAPIQSLADQIKEIKRLLDLYDNAINI